jgi:hypothetical protein
MKTTVTFNTGRFYNGKDQVITACWDDEQESMSFVDHNLGTCGVMWRSARVMSNSPSHIATEVMKRYDRMDYIPVEAWQVHGACVRQPKVHLFDL